MTDRKAGEPDPDDGASQWIKSTGDLWAQVLKGWTGWTGHGSPSQGDPGGKAAASMAAAMKAFQSLSSAMGDPESMASWFKGAGAMPDLVAKMVQTGLAGILAAQQKWVEQATRIGRKAEAYTFEDLDENVFQAWADIYEKEFRPFLNLPQLGLTRLYQENINQAADAFNVLANTMGEFGRLLSLPVSRSLAVIQEQVGKLAESGELPEDAKSYYQMWIKILEGHYMTLFQSTEYVDTLGRTLEALSRFTSAKDRVLEALMGTLPIPSQTDVDELYAEIYQLKKRIKALEKKAG